MPRNNPSPRPSHCFAGRGSPKTELGRNPEFNGSRVRGWVRCVITPAWIFEVRGNLPCHWRGGRQTRKGPSAGGLPPDT